MKNKGFTLVELLAVIVVLAIIMIVAVPSVLNALDAARQKSFSLFAENAIRKTMEVYQNEELKQENNHKSVSGTLESGDTITRDYCYPLEVTGLETGDKYFGSIWFDEDNNTYYVYLSDGVYYTEIDSEYLGVTLSDLKDGNKILLVADLESSSEEDYQDYFGPLGRIGNCGFKGSFKPITLPPITRITIPRPTKPKVTIWKIEDLH